MTPRLAPKTPYELRADLLRLAFDILMAKASVEKSEAPTTEEVIVEAKKLNQFVSSSNQE